ncbi:MAG: ferrous iron transport protein B, partial [Pseudomonadota bacterium]
RWLGIPIFLFLIYLMFELSMNIGTLLQPLFDISSTTLFINGFSYLGHIWGVPPWITAIFAEGIGLGVNTVVNFIPQIGLMFLFLSLLEDSGYMARAAFVMDRFMQFAGLPGKSFVPLIVGFGCNVPGIMATRTLDSRRDRILTCMMSPFMSCGARMAIFVVFVGAFFPRHGGFILFLLYIIGIAVAILTGVLLKKSILRSESSPFVLELPIYHVPTMRSTLYLTWNRLKRFIFRAGKVIIPVCVLIGSLNSIEIHHQTVKHANQTSQHSLLSYVGRGITPVLAPMGVKQDNWPATVGLITGTLAKEVVIGTLNTLYTQNNNSLENAYKDFHLWQGLKSSVTQTVSGFSQVFSGTMLNPFTANEADHDMSKTAIGNMVAAFSTPVAAFAYLLFVLLYIPCVSTIGVLTREVGKAWAWGSTIWSFYIAYSLAVIFYQVCTFALHPLRSILWIAGLLLIQAIVFIVLRSWANVVED